MCLNLHNAIALGLGFVSVDPFCRGLQLRGVEEPAEEDVGEGEGKTFTASKRQVHIAMLMPAVCAVAESCFRATTGTSFLHVVEVEEAPVPVYMVKVSQKTVWKTVSLLAVSDEIVA